MRDTSDVINELVKMMIESFSDDKNVNMTAGIFCLEMAKWRMCHMVDEIERGEFDDEKRIVEEEPE